MKKGKLLLVVLSAMLFAFNANASHLKDNLLISARLNGAQQVPVVTTNAQGVGSLMLNATRDTICVNISVTGLSSAITGIHIHEGDPGMNGGVTKDLMPFLVGNNVTTILTGADVSAMNISKFLSGKFYLNVHTATNPNGEIRGQLYLETDWSFAAILDGAQEVPAVVTTAYGVGFFNLSKSLSKIKFHVVVQGLSGAITAAHLHNAASGMSGGVVVDLNAYISGNVISGTISAPSQMLIDSLMASKIYLNVHTAANPGGEIRGQLMNNKRYLYFNASLDGNQEVPAITTTAMGAATIKLNATTDTLWYDVSVNGLSGPISSAHFHNAALGVSGGVEYSLGPDINGNRITGTITGAELTTTLVNKFLRGEIYVNVHTAANPGGEIRGQVYRLAREGYTFILDGSQQVPAVSTTATGSGMVSIDHDQDNAHFMFVSSGLTSTAVHFHNGVMGQSGGVVYDLVPFFANNGAFGYWTSSDVTPFTLANSVQFRDESIYVNIHTDANPIGEIRGQVLRGFQCFSSISTGINDNLPYSSTELNLYPNPAYDMLNLNINTQENSNMNVVIIDMLGKQVYSEKIRVNSGNNNHSFNLNALSSGIYSVIIQNENKQIVRKFIKL